MSKYLQLAFIARILILAVHLNHAASGGLMDGAVWSEDFEDSRHWRAMHTWLQNPSEQAKLQFTTGKARFSVPEPGRGMKWRREITPVWLPECPYLVLKYRAHNVRTDSDDYAVYVDDGAPPDLYAIRLMDLVADGQWHTVGVDLRDLTTRESVSAIAVQVQATDAGDAVLELSCLGFAPAPPRDCTPIRTAERGSASATDWVMAFAELTWAHKPDWLGNPARQFASAGQPDRRCFDVSQPGLGMKWQCELPEPLSLSAYRYVALEYRAAGVAPRDDYAVCAVGPAEDGADYEALVRLKDLDADGRWHIAVQDLAKAASRIPVCESLAVQVQAESADAGLEIRRLRLTSKRPAVPLRYVADVAQGAAFDGFRPVALAELRTEPVSSLVAHLHVSDWPDFEALTVDGIPFALDGKSSCAPGIGLREEGSLRVPLSGTAAEIFALVLTAFTGPEEPVYGGGAFSAIRQPDRFVARVIYRSGEPTESLPVRMSSSEHELKEGLQVLCIPADPDREMKAVELELRSTQAALALCALTVRTDPERLCKRWILDTQPLLAPPPRPRPKESANGLRLDGASAVLDRPGFTAVFDLKPIPRLKRLRDKIAGKELIDPDSAIALLSVSLRGQEIGAEDYRLVEARRNGQNGFCLTYALGKGGEARAVVCISARADGRQVLDSLSLDLSLEVAEGEMRSVSCTFPRVGPFRLAEGAEDSWLIYPSCGSFFTNRQTKLSAYYSGRFPLQFMAAVAPTENTGVCYRTEDTEGIERFFTALKDSTGITFSLDYPEGAFSLGGAGQTARTVLSITDGDWHSGLGLYKEWLGTWYAPAAPRKQWFREVFNFRQRFLHWLDPLYDAESGDVGLLAAIHEGKAFGGIDYLHVFDWGNCGPYGRIYGRVGDYSPYDYIKGGRESLADAIKSVQAQGVPVGLYIEGYLLQEKGRLGQAHGKQWQIVDRNGNGRYWPSSSEMFVCPGVAEWRKVQAATYAQKVSELNVSGMYIDQFGFAGTDKKCWSATHGHPVPSFPVLTERGLSRMVRRAVDAAKPGVALYTEETPCDVNSQFQDGSFSYAMRHCMQHGVSVPLNLTRFAIPSFKVFQILVCDKPTASWAEGVAVTFFNGDGIWLEGPADEWFHPGTLVMISRCHRILREHRRAFLSENPVPLVPTQTGGIYANLFPSEEEEVYTVFNSHYRTLTAPVFRFTHQTGVTYFDAWNEEALVPLRDGDFDVISLSLPPRGVGCVVRRLAGR